MVINNNFEMSLTINFVGNFQNGPGGEKADEAHLADTMQGLGHEVRRIPRDEWREYVIETDLAKKNQYAGVPKDLRADINIIAKWHHFYDGSFIEYLRSLSDAPVFYWVWDSCDIGIDWHRKMAQAADLYLSGELGRAKEFREHGIKFYYFQMDVVEELQRFTVHMDKLYDVVYLGSCDNQNGRIDLLKAINKEIPIQVFGHDWNIWQEQGFTANPAVYGEEANRVIGQAKVVLGTSCDPHLYGYWSNRVGRVLFAKGKLLQQYAPGMENFLHDWVEYFSTADEAVEKINALLGGMTHARRAQYDSLLFTSNQKMRDLLILIERFIKEEHGKLWQLP